jgi:hypothetical protein
VPALPAADLSADEYESDEDVGYRRIPIDTQARRTRLQLGVLGCNGLY